MLHIDLVIEDASGDVTIVDYRTDAVTVSILPDLQAIYAPQMETYTTALRKRGVERISAKLLFLGHWKQVDGSARGCVWFIGRTTHQEGAQMALARKNLIVDASKVRQLAAKLKTSESEAVRRAVDTLLLESQVAEAIARLRKRGTLRDAYHRVHRGNR